jgi:NADPH-dependent ferric siderophore reductase
MRPDSFDADRFDAIVLANLPRHTQGTVWIEVPDAGDVQPLDAPSAVTVRFLPRKGAMPGRLLTQAMRDEASVSETAAVWAAAERAAALELREHFEAMRPRQRVHTSGYCRMPYSQAANFNRFPPDARTA